MLQIDEQRLQQRLQLNKLFKLFILLSSRWFLQILHLQIISFNDKGKDKGKEEIVIKYVKTLQDSYLF